MTHVDSVGVYWHKKSGKWAAQIRNGPAVIHIGLFENKLDACRAYDKRARQLRNHPKKVLNFVYPED